MAAHVIGDGQHKAGRQLPEGRARAGEGGRIGEEALAGQQVIKFAARLHIAAPRLFHPGDMIGHPPEHFFHGLSRLAIIAAAHIAADEHLAGIVGQPISLNRITTSVFHSNSGEPGIMLGMISKRAFLNVFTVHIHSVLVLILFTGCNTDSARAGRFSR
jgi:hypothetical protein